MAKLRKVFKLAGVRPEVFQALKHILAQHRFRAANKGLLFTLDFIQFKELVQRDCLYCGERPRNVYRGKLGFRFYYQGLDRLINAEGYTLENVVPCCSACNAMKSDILTPSEMLAVAKTLKKMRSKP